MSIFKDFNDIQIHFSKAIGTKIVNEDGIRLGKLSDFFVDYEEVYPLVLAIQYKNSGQSFYIAWDEIKEYSYKKIVVSNNSFQGRSRTFPKAQNKKVITSLLANQFTGETVEYPPLGKIVLDRQIVDTSGKKVVRVNDIQMIKAGKNLRVTHAAIGLRSMMRRLGYERIIDSTIKFIRPEAKYLKSEVLINWKFVHAIPNKSIQSSVKLNLTNEDIKELHPADLADILEDLDNHGREIIFNNLDPKMAAETLSEVEDDLQVTLLKNEDPERAADIIEEMDTDDAADLLSEIGAKTAEDIISRIDDDEIQEEIQELLEYQDNTAGGLMSTEYFSVAKTNRKEEIIERIQKEHENLETIYSMYIVDDHNKLIGQCSLRRLIAQKENIEVGVVMNSKDIKYLHPETHWKEVATFMSKYNLMYAPVISEENSKLLGIISVDDLLPWLLNER
jgi:CBS domain-containing protein/sporulation protein YlmC with PRC-barrel domain